MKKRFIFLLATFLFLTVTLKHADALSSNQSEEIQSLLDEASRISGVPGLSLSIVDNGETFYFSSGYANREEKIPATQHTLYELASVSKAFTGTGILLLEDQGLLSITDPISEYLPWLTLHFEGEALEMDSLTLNHFLHHTSGLTNTTHFQNIPEGDSKEMLRATVETLAGADLDFRPGEQYSYGTVNYDVLGLVIEVATGKSYELFMTDEVFQPLGLANTYLWEADAQASGQLAQGYRTSFFNANPYDAPVFAGNKPAGYVISSATDMARWLQIQLGLIDGIPERFHRAIEKSHQGNNAVASDHGLYYGGGWLINEDKSYIEHDGMNPNFSSQVLLFPNEGQAIALLANGVNTNNMNIVEGVKQIIDGNHAVEYEMSAVQVSGILLASATILLVLLTILVLFYGRYRQEKTQRRNKIWFISSLVLTIGLLVLVFVYPSLIGYTWKTLLVWQPYSLLTTLIALFLFSASISWFIWENKI